MGHTKVTEDECDRLNELSDEGVPYRTIAAERDWHHSTVVTHCTNQCEHQWAEKPDTPSKAEMRDALARLAADRERVPSTHEWNHWEAKPCYARSVKGRFGSWQDALTAAGLAPLPAHTPEGIRAAAYQRPELTASTEDEYQAKQAEVSD